MAAFDFRNDRIRQEMTDAIADEAWGAIKDWQLADEDRPQTIDAATVRKATEDYLREIGRHTDTIALVEQGAPTILARLERTGAGVYLDR